MTDGHDEEEKRRGESVRLMGGWVLDAREQEGNGLGSCPPVDEGPRLALRSLKTSCLQRHRPRPLLLTTALLRGSRNPPSSAQPVLPDPRVGPRPSLPTPNALPSHSMPKDTNMSTPSQSSELPEPFIFAYSLLTQSSLSRPSQLPSNTLANPTLSRSTSPPERSSSRSRSTLRRVSLLTGEYVALWFECAG